MCDLCASVSCVCVCVCVCVVCDTSELVHTYPCRNISCLVATIAFGIISPSQMTKSSATTRLQTYYIAASIQEYLVKPVLCSTIVQ